MSPTVPLPARTSTLSLTPDGSRVYMLGRGISVLDVRSGAVTGLVGEIPDSFNSSTIDADGRTAYVTYSLRTDIGIIDLTDGREIGSIPIGTTDASLAQTRDGYLFVTGGHDPANAGRADRGLVVHTPTRRVVGTLPEFAQDVAVDAAGDRAFVLLPRGEVAIVDAGSGTPIGPPVRGFPDSMSSLAVTPGGNAMLSWGLLLDTSVLHIADTTGAPRQDLDTGAEIRGVSLSPDGRTLYVTVRGRRNAVLVYDTSGLVP
jgi:DNA-binding beta-propeller fold protein YncE